MYMKCLMCSSRRIFLPVFIIIVIYYLYVSVSWNSFLTLLGQIIHNTQDSSVVENTHNQGYANGFVCVGTFNRNVAENRKNTSFFLLFFFFAVGADLNWEDQWASKRCLLKWSQLLQINWVFLSLPSFARPPLSSLWYELLCEKQVRFASSPCFQINRLVMAVYPEYKSHYAQGS